MYERQFFNDLLQDDLHAFYDLLALCADGADTGLKTYRCPVLPYLICCRPNLSNDVRHSGLGKLRLGESDRVLRWVQPLNWRGGSLLDLRERRLCPLVSITRYPDGTILLSGYGKLSTGKTCQYGRTWRLPGCQHSPFSYHPQISWQSHRGKSQRAHSHTQPGPGEMEVLCSAFATVFCLGGILIFTRPL